MGSCVVRPKKFRSNRNLIDLGEFDFLVVGRKKHDGSSEQTSYFEKKHSNVPTLDIESNSLRRRRLSNCGDSVIANL